VDCVNDQGATQVAVLTECWYGQMRWWSRAPCGGGEFHASNKARFLPVSHHLTRIGADRSGRKWDVVWGSLRRCDSCSRACRVLKRLRAQASAVGRGAFGLRDGIGRAVVPVSRGRDLVTICRSKQKPMGDWRARRFAGEERS